MIWDAEAKSERRTWWVSSLWNIGRRSLLNVALLHEVQLRHRRNLTAISVFWDRVLAEVA